jgi:hypothetical protein
MEAAADVWYSDRYHAQPSQSNQHTLECGYGVKGLSVVQGAVPYQQHWYQGHTIRDVASLHTS